MNFRVESKVRVLTSKAVHSYVSSQLDYYIRTCVCEKSSQKTTVVLERKKLYCFHHYGSDSEVCAIYFYSFCGKLLEV